MHQLLTTTHWRTQLQVPGRERERGFWQKGLQRFGFLHEGRAPKRDEAAEIPVGKDLKSC